MRASIEFCLEPTKKFASFRLVCPFSLLSKNSEIMARERLKPKVYYRRWIGILGAASYLPTLAYSSTQCLDLGSLRILHPHFALFGVSKNQS